MQAVQLHIHSCVSLLPDVCSHVYLKQRQYAKISLVWGMTPHQLLK